MSSGAVEVELDKQGRILVPGYLREYAGLRRGKSSWWGPSTGSRSGRRPPGCRIAPRSRTSQRRSPSTWPTSGSRGATHMTHVATPPFMRLRAVRPAVRHERCSREWEKGTCRSSSTRLLPRWRSGAGSSIADCTVGGGGHAARLLETSSPDGRLLGIDADRAAIMEAHRTLERFGDRVILRQANFAALLDGRDGGRTSAARRRALRPWPVQLPAGGRATRLQLRCGCAAGHALR